MRRELDGGYELDDDRDRVDVEAVHRFLADEAYWVRGRSREIVERLVRDSTLVIGAYAPDGRSPGSRASCPTARTWRGSATSSSSMSTAVAGSGPS